MAILTKPDRFCLVAAGRECKDRLMRAILYYCGDIPLEHVPGGTVLLEEGQNTGRVYVLAKGRIEVIRGDTQVAVLDEPGSLVGEMSVLLGAPHTATARALGDAKIHQGWKDVFSNPS